MYLQEKRKIQFIWSLKVVEGWVFLIALSLIQELYDSKRIANRAKKHFGKALQVADLLDVQWFLNWSHLFNC